MTEPASIRAEVDAALRAWREAATHVVLVIAVIGLPVSVYFFTEKALAYPSRAKRIGMSLYGVAGRQAWHAQDTFSRQVLATQEKVRRRIAGELQDELGQDLLLIANQAQLGPSRSGSSPDTTERLNDI